MFSILEDAWARSGRPLSVLVTMLSLAALAGCSPDLSAKCTAPADCPQDAPVCNAGYCFAVDDASSVVADGSLGDVGIMADAADHAPDSSLDPDAAVVDSDAAVVDPDAATVDPDATIGPDAELIGPDAELIGPDAELIGPDAELIGPDAAVGPDAEVGPLCPNGQVEPEEECDDLNDPAETCDEGCAVVPLAVPLDSTTIQAHPRRFDVYTFETEIQTSVTFRMLDDGGDCRGGFTLQLKTQRGDPIALQGAECAHGAYLQPGTYSLRVERPQLEIFEAVGLELLPVQECGNGLVEGDEACDGDAENCLQCRRPDCGNGRLDAVEECDPGEADVTSCSLRCEVVPINITHQADGRWLSAEHLRRRDEFVFDAAAYGTLTFEPSAQSQLTFAIYASTSPEPILSSIINPADDPPSRSIEVLPGVQYTVKIYGQQSVAGEVPRLPPDFQVRFTTTVCGNGQIEPGEQCDLGPDPAPGAACTATCAVNGCTPWVQGDGVCFPAPAPECGETEVFVFSESRCQALPCPGTAVRNPASPGACEPAIIDCGDGAQLPPGPVECLEGWACPVGFRVFRPNGDLTFACEPALDTPLPPPQNCNTDRTRGRVVSTGCAEVLGPCGNLDARWRLLGSRDNFVLVDPSRGPGMANGSLRSPFRTLDDALSAVENRDNIDSVGLNVGNYVLNEDRDLPRGVHIEGVCWASSVLQGQWDLSRDASFKDVKFLDAADVPLAMDGGDYTLNRVFFEAAGMRAIDIKAGQFEGTEIYANGSVRVEESGHFECVNCKLSGVFDGVLVQGDGVAVLTDTSITAVGFGQENPQPALRIEGGNVTVDGLTISISFGVGLGIQNATLSGSSLLIDRSLGHGIQVRGGTVLNLEDTVLVRSGGDAINAAGADASQVRFNRLSVLGAGGSAIDTRGRASLIIEDAAFLGAAMASVRVGTTAGNAPALRLTNAQIYSESGAPGFALNGPSTNVLLRRIQLAAGGNFGVLAQGFLAGATLELQQVVVVPSQNAALDPNLDVVAVAVSGTDATISGLSVIGWPKTALGVADSAVVLADNVLIYTVPEYAGVGTAIRVDAAELSLSNLWLAGHEGEAVHATNGARLGLETAWIAGQTEQQDRPLGRGVRLADSVALLESVEMHAITGFGLSAQNSNIEVSEWVISDVVSDGAGGAPGYGILIDGPIASALNRVAIRRTAGAGILRQGGQLNLSDAFVLGALHGLLLGHAAGQSHSIDDSWFLFNSGVGVALLNTGAILTRVVSTNNEIGLSIQGNIEPQEQSTFIDGNNLERANCEANCPIIPSP